MKKIPFKNGFLSVFDGVYEPREDSFLLAEAVSVREKDRVLDMGCGCGIQGINAALQNAIVLSVDVSQLAVENAVFNARLFGVSDRLTAMQSNLFSALDGEKFDCIVFNPPYVPSLQQSDASIDGGKKGRDVLRNFLDNLFLHLTPKGKSYFLASSLNDFNWIERTLSLNGFGFSIVLRKRFFFEELAVFLCFKEH